MAQNVWLNRLSANNPRFLDDSPSSFKLVVRIALGAAFVGVGIKVFSKIIQYQSKRKRVFNSLSKPDVVILHQFPRGVTIPNISPFPLKVETYLRLAKIKYENDHRDYMGPKGKCPYITLNGEDIADSQIIIEHLNDVFNVDLNKGLSQQEKAIGRAFRIMLEDHLYWVNGYYRWVLDESQAIKDQLFGYSFPLTHLVYYTIRRHMKIAAWYQGLARHNNNEIVDIANQDLRAVSHLLGEKPFLFGDQPTEADCAVFGILAQLVWTCPGSFYEDILNGECRNLKDYCLRMKAQVWPDWDQCIKSK